MNKKFIIICISGLLALILLIVVAVAFLYSDSNASSVKKSRTEVAAKPEPILLQAVPSDAALIFNTSRFSKIVDMVSDSTSTLPVFVTDAVRARHPFYDFLTLLQKSGTNPLRNSKALISLHYSGNLEPLLIIDNGSSPADSSNAVKSILDLADSTGLYHSLLDCSQKVKSSSDLKHSVLLMVSASETLLTAAQRHIESNTSVIEQIGFANAAASVGQDALYISHDYSSRLMSSFFVKPYSSYGSFLTSFADWTAFSIDSGSNGKWTLKGSSACLSDENAAFVTVLSRAKAGDAEFASIVPASALSVLSLSTSDINSYIDAYSSFLDTKGRLEKYEQAINTVGDSLDISPLQWAKKLNIKEVVAADLSFEGECHSLLFLRTGSEAADIILRGSGKKNLKECAEVHPNVYRSYVQSLFGGLYSADDSYCVYRNAWMIYGSERAIQSLDGQTLDKLSGAMGLYIPSKSVNLSSYFSVSKSAQMLPDIFTKTLANAFRVSLNGITDKAVVLSISSRDVLVNVSRAKLELEKSKAESSVPVTLSVPQGPFKVKNSSSGKINTFNQSENGSLSLKDENGKSLWAIPFDGRLCGRVEAIDYYANGKLQYLFAAGDRLYLIDRLGRFVSSFPVSLGKKVLLGPSVYDFTGAHGYTAMVLHEDNTIAMYDLHGKTRDGWKNISPKETVMSMPELITVNSKKFWVVRTSAQTLLYDFMGGETLTLLSGDKRISPDSEIQVKNGTVSATSLDGKVRNVKL